MKRIYLAGPEVFLSDAVSIGDQKKKICEAYGFEGIFPIDNILELNEPSPQENGLKIGRANEELIESCDIVIANMTPFLSEARAAMWVQPMKWALVKR